MIQNKMDFSMYMNSFLKIFSLILVLSGCAPTVPDSTDWFDGYDTTNVGTPVTMQYGSPDDGYGTTTQDQTIHHIAVLLPTSGKNAPIGKTIKTSVETAVLQQNRPNLSISFFDTTENPATAIDQALATTPEIIIGPVFADNTRLLREKKPSSLPALSFTSDATAVGDGIMTMALMPTNSVESIIRQIYYDGKKSFIIIAPDTNSGKLMAATAQDAAQNNDLKLNGIFYYQENNPDSIKETSLHASMNTARTAANTRAREILSDILTNETLNILEKSDITMQLEKISRTDTLGTVPYQAILFLGNADDSTKLASFLRYYGISSRDASYYGTAIWDGTRISSDITMTGAKYAALPITDEIFANTYSQISGTTPSRMATIGYDATNMAIGMIYSDKTNAAYLLNPSGYIGTDGLFRLKPTGDNERALRIVRINGDGTTQTVKNAPQNFIKPIYSLEQRHVSSADAMELQTRGINPNDYIRIPERFINKYKSKTYGANTTHPSTTTRPDIVTILPEDDRDPIIVSEFTPVKLESVNRSYIEEIEIEE